MTEKQHKRDIFREGDEIPWHSDYATVVDREVTDELPDDVPDWGAPSDYHEVEQDDDASYAIISLEYDDEEVEKRLPATTLIDDLRESFHDHGLPRVQADAIPGMTGTSNVKAQTPSTGMNEMSPEEADLLASFLRAVAEFKPLWALLGGVESEEDMHAVADALERAAEVRKLGEQTLDD